MSYPFFRGAALAYASQATQLWLRNQMLRGKSQNSGSAFGGPQLWVAGCESWLEPRVPLRFLL